MSGGRVCLARPRSYPHINPEADEYDKRREVYESTFKTGIAALRQSYVRAHLSQAIRQVRNAFLRDCRSIFLCRVAEIAMNVSSVLRKNKCRARDIILICLLQEI